MEQRSKTAFGSALERFVAGLPRRARELSAAVTAVYEPERASTAQTELQHRLHSLLASAQLFEQKDLIKQVRPLAQRFDAIAAGQAPFDARDFGALAALIAQLSAAELPARPDALPRPQPSAADAIALVPPTASEQPDRAVGLARTLSGSVPAPPPIRVLLLCSRAHAARIREWLDDPAIELIHAPDPETAWQCVRAVAPDCALLAVEFATAPELDLVRRLRGEPPTRLGGGVYVLLPEGATFDAEFLRQTGADDVLTEPLSRAALEPVLARAGARAAGSGLRTLLSGSASADTVSEIAARVAEEIRSGIADSLQGGLHERVELGDTLELQALTRSAIGRVSAHLAERSQGRVHFHRLAAAADEQPEAGVSAPALRTQRSSLAGRRILIADDDPAVLWFHAGVLRDAGAEVMQAPDGRVALELARRHQPQLVLSDILMPEIDGFTLCRELKRDAVLGHVPVILLSWKEDFLERMRELDAGASGYLRKESSAEAVLQAVAAALAPLDRLSERLGETGSVAGRVEDLGVAPLLECVLAVRPDARVSIQDAWNLFELELRADDRYALTRTAADGSFARGQPVLAQLLGVNAGRFSISERHEALRLPLLEGFLAASSSAGRRLAALLDAVSDARLLKVESIAFDDDVVDFLLGCTPNRMQELVAVFRQAGASARELLLSGRFTPWELETHLRELARRGAIDGVWDGAGNDLVEGAQRERAERPGTLLHGSSGAAAHPAQFSSLRVRLPVASQLTAADAGALEVGAPPAEPVDTMPLGVTAGSSSPATGADRTSLGVGVVPTSLGVGADRTPGEAGIAPDAFDPDRKSGWFSAPSAAELNEPPRLHAALATGSVARLILTMAALVLVGYFGWQTLETSASVPVVAKTKAVGAKRPPSSKASPAAVSSEETALASGIDPALTLGRTLSYVDRSHGIAVAPDQGLLVIEYSGATPAPSLRLDDRALATPPLALALSAARHELQIQLGGATHVLSVIVHSGETRIISLPLPER
jgi:CheY-like chemotaxis protein